MKKMNAIISGKTARILLSKFVCWQHKVKEGGEWIKSLGVKKKKDTKLWRAMTAQIFKKNMVQDDSIINDV